MNSQSNQSFSRNTLEHWVRALGSQAPEADHVEAAQRKLLARLHSSTHRRSWGGPGWAWAATAVLAVLVLPLVLWMPGSNGSLAFADVQRHFSDFESLRARMTTQLRGQTVLDMEIRVDDRDRVRVDVGEGFSYVVDPRRESMLQLFHDRQQALRVTLDGADEVQREETLGWLEELREYRGIARRLEQPATIRGRQASGFSLEAGGLDMVLWATPEGEPLRLEIQPALDPAASGPTTRLEFYFDEPLDAGSFSLELPAGYELLAGEDAG